MTFSEVAQAFLDKLFARLYSLEKQLGWDINERPGVLEVKIPAVPSVYLIHRHDTLEQIWVSSPISGGWHFTFNAQRNEWYDTRNNRQLSTMLFLEFKLYIPKSLWESYGLLEKSSEIQTQDCS